MRRAAAAAPLALLLPAAGCGSGAARLGIDGKQPGPAEQTARGWAALVHGKFAYVGIPGTDRHAYEVSGPGLSDLVAVRLSRDGRLDSLALDPGPLLRGGLGTLLTTG